MTTTDGKKLCERKSENEWAKILAENSTATIANICTRARPCLRAMKWIDHNVPNYQTYQYAKEEANDTNKAKKNIQRKREKKNKLSHNRITLSTQPTDLVSSNHMTESIHSLNCVAVFCFVNLRTLNMLSYLPLPSTIDEYKKWSLHTLATSATNNVKERKLKRSQCKKRIHKMNRNRKWKKKRDKKRVTNERKK